MLIEDLDTPAVVVDLDVMETNLRRCQTYLDAPRPGAPPAHQDAQDPRLRASPAQTRSQGHHLPEARRSGGDGRCRHHRHPGDLQHRRPGQARPARGPGAPRRYQGGGGFGRGGGGVVGNHVPCRIDSAGAGRVRHGSRALRGGDAGGRSGAGRGDRPRPGALIPRVDDLPASGTRPQRFRSGWRRPWTAPAAPGSTLPWSAMAARPTSIMPTR